MAEGIFVKSVEGSDVLAWALADRAFVCVERKPSHCEDALLVVDVSATKSLATQTRGEQCIQANSTIIVFRHWFRDRISLHMLDTWRIKCGHNQLV